AGTRGRRPVAQRPRGRGDPAPGAGGTATAGQLLVGAAGGDAAVAPGVRAARPAAAGQPGLSRGSAPPPAEVPRRGGGPVPAPGLARLRAGGAGAGRPRRLVLQVAGAGPRRLCAAV